MILHYTIDCSAVGNTVPGVVIPLEQGGVAFDSCSIQAEGSEAFSTGVVTLKKTNDKSMAPVNINGTPVTIAAVGLTELVKADWIKAGFLVPEVTTAQAGLTVTLAVCLKHIGGGGPT